MTLKEDEERLEFLISRIESEIEKYNELKKELQQKQVLISEKLLEKNLQPVPIIIGEKENLLEKIESHLNELNQMKNRINQKLNNVMKEEELNESLSNELEGKVEIKKVSDNQFEIHYNDATTESIGNQISAGKKLIEQLKEKLK